eukprot:TRINITY_DN3475_c0_g1_i2.p1 TRINITY_DN3475_c0_g1~~TRINITY_DN3475_c0_g1_i2.p1  ORF type:complete len:251 (+),score=38.15 TRINITY_DN3475_c0_g1_i2:24-776(+)
MRAIFPSLFKRSLIFAFRSPFPRPTTMDIDVNQLHDELPQMRQDYRAGTLLEDDIVEGDPFKQFTKWFEEAKERGIYEPNAMTLSTVGESGRPSSRVVLLKDASESGFVFYTNYNSRKGKEIAHNPYVSATFWWHQRSVRVEGKAHRVSAEESDAYYNSRPRGSRLGAWASEQSNVIASRDILDNRAKELEEEYAEKEHIPRPPWWGGLCIVPFRIEFWQGRTSRLHDRLVFTRDEGKTDNAWDMHRLNP